MNLLLFRVSGYYDKPVLVWSVSTEYALTAAKELKHGDGETLELAETSDHPYVALVDVVFELHHIDSSLTEPPPTDWVDRVWSDHPGDYGWVAMWNYVPSEREILDVLERQQRPAGKYTLICKAEGHYSHELTDSYACSNKWFEYRPPTKASIKDYVYIDRWVTKIEGSESNRERLAKKHALHTRDNTSGH